MFSTLPSAATDLNVHSIGTARKVIVSSLQLELMSMSLVKNMISEDRHALTQPISDL